MISAFRKIELWSATTRLAVVLNGLLLAQSALAFQHPGIPLTVADLNNIKANLNNWPWSEGYSQLVSDYRSQLSYTMQGPFGYVNRNNAGNYDHESAWKNDMQAIFNLSRMWYFTSNSAYAQKAHDILLAWANTMTNFGGIESALDLGDYAYRYAEGADILRGTWPGWTTADTLTVSNFFRKVYLPATGVSSSLDVLGPSNKGALQMSGALACAVFCDDTNLFNHVLYLYRTSASCGLDNNCLSSGEMGETGRDQGHAYDDLLQMAFCAEVFWKQGVDVYSADDNRLLACGEYWSRNNVSPAAKYITYGTTDYIYWNNSTNSGGSSAGGAFAAEPMACNILRSAYVLRKGLSAPWMVLKRYAAAGTTVTNSQSENMDSFCYLKSGDTSTAAPPPAITYPSVSTVTTGLIHTDIGSATPPGRGFYNAGTWTVTGAGTNTWTHGPDSCQFDYQQITGDCTIIARVDSVQEIAATSKAGVMIRDSLSSNAGNRAWVAITASSTIESYNSGWTQIYGGANWETYPYSGVGGWLHSPSMPYWVKLQRLGNTISTYVSLDGASWEVCTVAVFDNMPSTAYVGLFVCSLVDGRPCTATFGDVSVTGGDGGNVTVPPAPYAIYASPDAGQVPLRWLKSFGATSYTVYRSTTNGGPYTSIATVTNASYIDPNLPPGTSYYYVVTASNSAGTSAYSPQDSATTQPVPSVPTGLGIWSGDSVLRLGWTASSTATSYNIWRANAGGGPYTLVGSSTSTGYLDSGLTNGTTYYYVVSAVSAAGESAYSAEISGTPSAHTAISVNFQGGSTQNGTPSAMASAEDAGWVVASNWNNAASSGTAGSLGALKQNDGMTTAASVNWSCHNLWSTTIPDAPGDYRMMKGYLDSYGSSVSTVSVSGLPAAYTTNGYEVFVYFDGDNSAERTAYYTIGGTTITAMDAAGVNYGGKYVLANNSAGNCMVFHNLSGSGFTLNATGNAADGAGARAPINGIQIVAQWVTNAPPAPTGLTATAGDGQATLEWNVLPGATGYNLKRSDDGGVTYNEVASTSATNFTDHGLNNGFVYYYGVAGLYSGNSTPDSAPVSVRPVSGVPPPLSATFDGQRLELLWPRANTGWRLQAQTNSSCAGLGTNWMDVAGSTNLDQVAVPINPTNGSVFFRLVYP